MLCWHIRERCPIVGDFINLFEPSPLLLMCDIFDWILRYPQKLIKMSSFFPLDSLYRESINGPPHIPHCVAKKIATWSEGNLFGNGNRDYDHFVWRWELIEWKMRNREEEKKLIKRRVWVLDKFWRCWVCAPVVNDGSRRKKWERHTKALIKVNTAQAQLHERLINIGPSIRHKVLSTGTKQNDVEGKKSQNSFDNRNYFSFSPPPRSKVYSRPQWSIDSRRRTERHDGWR